MRIALLMPRGDYESTPCVKNLAEGLVEKGLTVDVYTIQNKAFPEPEVDSVIDQEARKRLSIFYSPFFKQNKFWENVPLVMAGFSMWSAYKLRKSDYNFVIACGVRALFIVGLFSLLIRTKVIFNSLELYLYGESNSIKNKLLKKAEIFFSKSVNFSIIQDEKRAAILARENRVSKESILIFPNSPKGSAQLRDSVARARLIDKYNLPEDAKLILYSGSFFARWAMVDELLKSVKSWPENWALILHSRTNAVDVEEKYGELFSNSSGRIILSNEALSNTEYEYLVRGCDIGVSLYDGAISDNIKYVGLSSGKLAQYLKYGLPVVVNELPMWTEIIDQYKCGKTIKSHDDIKSSIDEILADYATYSGNSTRTFDAVFSLDSYVDGIVSRISE